MRAWPKGGLIGKTVHGFRKVAALRVGLYAANACYFMVLSVFPALLLFFGLLRYTALEVESLAPLLEGILPAALLGAAEELILLTYDASSTAAVGVSAFTTLWSASRGIYGLIAGLNRVYGVEETRSYLHRRALSVGYTFAFFLVVLLTLGLHVFGTELLELARREQLPLIRFLTRAVDLRFLLLTAVQTGVFAAMFTALPNRPGRFRSSLPGALLACGGWLIFSKLYGVYVERFARLTTVYGSLYGVALSMLWLYCCISIVFYGGLLNRYLSENN